MSEPVEVPSTIEVAGGQCYILVTLTDEQINQLAVAIAKALTEKPK